MNLLFESLQDQRASAEWNHLVEEERVSAHFVACEFLCNCDALLSPQSLKNATDCLHRLIDRSLSNHVNVFFMKDLPGGHQEFLVSCMSHLFFQFFARKADPRTSGGRKTDTNPANILCYMWWDLFPFRPHLEIPEIESATFRCFTELLLSGNQALRESAFHGIYHWCLMPGENTSEHIRHLRSYKFPHEISEELSFTIRRAGLSN